MYIGGRCIDFNSPEIHLKNEDRQSKNNYEIVSNSGLPESDLAVVPFRLLQGLPFNVIGLWINEFQPVFSFLI